ncbi:MAG: LPS export ABC transporter ATP-binding protein [Candidatus Acididesulfobacter diazotrophicus]|uniref:LPS export ABC transporter ATP-binding protein n=1 Tax=Candidatus Acididesulfobacter diazotrophicus TaxID=2597226 RepID=A0A519BP83_9DELT|nr:MAG: LPS export ABC transporter ATP-binding protein [Candidatus Acididesulfobacter diazotrophicus]
MLKADNLIKTFKKRTVVNDISLEITIGEITGLLGPNGAGKTTTFNMISGMIKPNKGTISINGLNITKEPMYKRARLGISYLPQESSVFRKLTAEENLLAIFELLKISKTEINKRLDNLIERFGLGTVRKSNVMSLSGGERRRVEVARSLILAPKFILLDEPFSGIDPIAVEDMQDILLELKKESIGILITDHNVREALRICDSAYIINDGQIIEKGKPSQIITSNVVRRFFLGEKFSLGN